MTYNDIMNHYAIIIITIIDGEHINVCCLCKRLIIVAIMPTKNTNIVQTIINSFIHNNGVVKVSRRWR